LYWGTVLVGQTRASAPRIRQSCYRIRLGTGLHICITCFFTTQLEALWQPKRSKRSHQICKIKVQKTGKWEALEPSALKERQRLLHLYCKFAYLHGNSEEGSRYLKRVTILFEGTHLKEILTSALDEREWSAFMT
jgi:hypothetical protein